MQIERLRTLLGILQEAHGIPKSKACMTERNGGRNKSASKLSTRPKTATQQSKG
nr:MAG TPA: hypothetical protein [Caudoviricetes sp.]